MGEAMARLMSVHDLGQKLLHGHGVSVDEARAMEWFRLE